MLLAGLSPTLITPAASLQSISWWSFKLELSFPGTGAVP